MHYLGLNSDPNGLVTNPIAVRKVVHAGSLLLEHQNGVTSPGYYEIVIGKNPYGRFRDLAWCIAVQLDGSEIRGRTLGVRLTTR
jgi:hypothetical protein